jgi:hypothetical protein
MIQETELKVRQACDLRFSTLLDPTRLPKCCGVQAQPGKVYRFRIMTSYVPGTLHSEPHWQAVRMIKLAQWKGFARLDASFFYLYSMVHPASPQSMAPFGLSQRDPYKGHAFWDTESFMAMLPLLTDPAAAKAILDYRFDRLPAGRHYQRVPDAVTTTFITGRGSLMAGLMMGLQRIDIWQENPDDWFAGPIVMPAGWDGRVYLRGRPGRITAMHGAPRAEVVWLDDRIEDQEEA